VKSRPLIIAGVALLVLACGTSTKKGSGKAPAQAPTTPPVATTVKIGETMTMTRDMLGQKTTVDILVSNLRTNANSGNQFMTPDKGQFVVVDVAITCKAGKYDANPYSFKFVGPDGAVSDPALPIVKPDLGVAELTAGQNTKGAVTFDVPKGAEKGGKIVLKDPLSQNDAGFWALP
jgi:hypothetical protein